MISYKCLLGTLAGTLLLPGTMLAQTINLSPGNYPPVQTNWLQQIIEKQTVSEEKVQELQILYCAGLTGLTPARREEFKQLYTALKDKQEWLILLDPDHSLSGPYDPGDLVGSGRTKMRREAHDYMNAMIAAAKKDGVTLEPLSGYRTWEYQAGLLSKSKNPQYVAKPGQSQHHLGTAMDFNTVDPRLENIPAMKWLRKHAGEYGFSLSFPKGKEAEEESGYPYEAWHYRYITMDAVALQDGFFDGDQHRTLKFMLDCIFQKQDF